MEAEGSSEGNQGYEGSTDTMDFTGFIFGNVDEKGNLEGNSILNKVVLC